MSYLKNWPAFGRGRLLFTAILFMVASFLMGLDQLQQVRQYGFDYIPPGRTDSVGKLCVSGFAGAFIVLVITAVVWRAWRIANR